MAITREQAMTAREFHITDHRGRPCDSKNGPIRWRRNGKTQTWVRKPTAFRVPVKHGLFTYDYIDQQALDDPGIHALEDCPVFKQYDAPAGAGDEVEAYRG